MRQIILPICLLVALSGAVHAQTPGAVTPDQPVIVAQGDSILILPPDRAYLQIAAEATAGKIADAQRQAATTMTTLETTIKGLGLGADALRTLSYMVQPTWDRQYVARQVMEVRVDDLTRLASMIDAAGTAKGSSVSGLRFDLKNRGAAELDALRRAVRDANERAKVIAEGVGRTVGEIVRLQEQRSSSASPVFRMDAGGAGAGGRGGGAPVATPIEPGEIQVRAQVTLTVVIR